MATLTIRGLSRTDSGRTGAGRSDRGRAGIDTPPLRAITFEVADGRVAALLGARGAGTTALLRLIAGLDRPEAGEVLVGGVDLTRVGAGRRGITLLAREIALLPGKDVRGNVDYALRGMGLAPSERDAAVATALASLRLSALATVPPAALSEADQQRVAIARTLAPEPAVALLDEPLGTLAGAERQVLRRELRTALHARGTTAVLATSDPDDAAAVADDLVVLVAGRVLQSGATAEVMANPASSAVATLLGYVTLAQGEVQARRVVEAGAGAIAIPRGMPVGVGARVMAHPASLLAVPAGRGLGCGVSGPVLAALSAGPMHRLEVAIGPRVIEVRWEWDLLPPPAGSVVDLAVRPDTLRFFEEPNGSAMHVHRSAGGA